MKDGNRRVFGLFLLLCAQLATGFAFGQTEPPTQDHPSVRIGPLEIHERRGRAGDKVSIGNDLHVAAGERVHTAVVVAGNAVIDGEIRNDLVVVLGSVTLGPGALVGGDLVLVGGMATIDPAATIEGERTILALNPRWIWARSVQEWVRHGLLLGRPLPHQSRVAWVVGAGFLLLYVVMLALLPAPLQASVRAVEKRPISSFFTGLLTFVLLGPLLLLLIVSVVGLVVVPVLGAGLLLAFLFGKAAVYEYAGRQLGLQFGLKSVQSPLLALFLGTILFYAVYMVPFLGFLVWGLTATIGMGAALIALFGSFRSETPPAPLLVPAPGVSQGAAGTEGTVAPVTEAWARAGFWLRLLATLLDALLIGTLAALLGLRRYTILVWALYHLVMWSWRGTTIGGIVVGLKVVRRDGRPITFAVALVRCLSAFFSAIVLFLGFFWAGWDREKQSWHDKIAGTTMVKVPRGTSLV